MYIRRGNVSPVPCQAAVHEHMDEEAESRKEASWPNMRVSEPELFN